MSGPGRWASKANGSAVQSDPGNYNISKKTTVAQKKTTAPIGFQHNLSIGRHLLSRHGLLFNRIYLWMQPASTLPGRRGGGFSYNINVGNGPDLKPPANEPLRGKGCFCCCLPSRSSVGFPLPGPLPGQRVYQPIDRRIKEKKKKKMFVASNGRNTRLSPRKRKKTGCLAFCRLFFPLGNTNVFFFFLFKKRR